MTVQREEYYYAEALRMLGGRGPLAGSRLVVALEEWH